MTGWVSDPDGRGTLTVIWTSLLTWFLCLWTMFHPNIPAYNERERDILFRRTWYLIFGAIAPEWIASIAVTQWRDAQRFLKAVTRLRERCHEKDLPSNVLAEWSLVHAFYAVMGGFVVEIPGTEPSLRVPVNANQFCWLLENRVVEIPTITEQDIKDKSKMDGLVKAITLLQTGYFIIQCIARGAQGLAVSLIEVTTIAYIACMLVWMLFWWRKPYDLAAATLLNTIQWEPEYRDKLKELSDGDGYVLYRLRDLREYPRRPNSIVIEAGWMTKDITESPNWYGAIFTSLLFGGLHCIAWNFEFPTTIERWLWRVSGLVIIFIGCLGWWGNWYTYRNLKKRRWLQEQITNFFNVIYIVVRIYLMVEIFLQFRHMPASVYDTVDWTLYFPSFN